MVVSIWQTWEDIQAWTGPDVSKPLDQDLPAMFETRVEHYESVDLAGGLVPPSGQAPESQGRAGQGPGS